MRKRVIGTILFFTLSLLFCASFSIAAPPPSTATYTPTSLQSCSETSCTTTLYSYEQYFNRDGVWEVIDESWQACAEGYCTNAYHFAATATPTGVVTVDAQGEALSMQLTSLFNQQVSFTPEVEGNTLTYPNILPGADLTYQYFPNKLKETIILHQPLSISPELQTITFITSGSVDATLEEPYMCDSTDTCTSLAYEADASTITLSIPSSFLTAATYPVIIDPTIIFNESAIAWNGRVRKQGTTYTRTSNPAAFRLGNVSSTETGFGAIDWNASLLTIQGTITNLTLQLYVENTASTQYILSKDMEKNSFLYTNNNAGNTLFYDDMSNGTVYANVSAGSSGTHVNLSFSASSLPILQQKLDSGILSLGLETNLTTQINISARDNPTASRRPLLIIQTELRSYNLSYDANGNLISGFDKLFTYDSRNDLIGINYTDGRPIARYWYTPDHERIKKVVYNMNSGGHNATTYYPFKEFVHVRLTNGTIYNETYVYLYDKLIAKIDNDNRKFFYHPDHMGSTTLITNESGAIVEEINYLPFGKQLAGTSDERFLYTGQEWDAESELLYYGARYYDPEFARFLQPDPIIQKPYDPQNLNRYSYVLNNPYKYTDPDGKSPELLLTNTAASYFVNNYIITPIVNYVQSNDAVCPNCQGTLNPLGYFEFGGIGFAAEKNILNKIGKEQSSGGSLLDDLDDAVAASGKGDGKSTITETKSGNTQDSSTNSLSKSEKSQLQHGFRHVADKFESFDNFVDYNNKISSQQWVNRFSDTLRGNRQVTGYYDSKRNIITYFDKKSGKYVTSIKPKESQLKNKGIKK